jgi:hypothetical protein
MRLREFSTPKSVSKDTNDIEAETIKRQQQNSQSSSYQAKAKKPCA